jgi:hypothetical protein
MAAAEAPYVWGVAWLPWVLHHLAQAPGEKTPTGWWRRVGWAALALSATLHGGDPMATWFVLFAALAQVVGLGDRNSRRSSLAALGVAGLLAAVVCCAQLMAASEVALAARPGGVELRLAGRWSTHPARLLEWLVPGAFGPPYGDSWFVHELYHRGHSGPREPLSAGLYQGIVCVPLALAALITRGRRRIDVALGGLTGLAVLLSLGVYTPVWRAFHAYVPMAAMFRAPEKYWFLVSLGLAALASRGLSVLREQPARLRTVALLVALPLLVFAVATTVRGPALALGLTGDLGRVPPIDAGLALTAAAWRAFAWALAWLLAALFVQKLAVSTRRRGELFAALVVLDLMAAAPALLAWAPGTVHTDPSPWLAVMRERAGGDLHGVRFLHPLDLPVGHTRPSAEILAATLPPDVGIAQGLTHVDPQDSSPPVEYLAAHRAMVGWPLRWMRLYGARFATLPTSAREPDLRPIATLPGKLFPLLEDVHPAPAVYLAEHAVAVANLDDALRAIMDARFVPGRDAVVQGGESLTTHGECHETARADSHVEISCRADQPGYLIVADSHYPGWSATVDRERASILPANGIFRAVRVPAGVSEVSMKYSPRGWPSSLWISLAGFGLCVVLIVRAPKRYREPVA